MNPPIVIGNATLYHADCQEILPTLENAQAIITDPPYFSTNLKLDKKSVPADWRMMTKAVHSNGYLVVFAPFEIQREIFPIWKLRFPGVWIKPMPVRKNSSAKKPFGMFELYVVYAHPEHQIRELIWNPVFVEGQRYRKIQRKSGYRRGGQDQLDRQGTSGWTQDGFVLESDGRRYCPDVLLGANKPCMAHEERTEHPTQKPLEVVNTLVQWVTNKNDLIIDPYMGSGSTGVSAVQLGRRFVGMEINQSYFEIACERLENAQRQSRLL